VKEKEEEEREMIMRGKRVRDIGVSLRRGQTRW